jgi:hypothetical protein
MAKFLQIALWSPNGLAQHKDEIQLFLQQNKIDILLINESHFTTKSYFKTVFLNLSETAAR